MGAVRRWRYIILLAIAVFLVISYPYAFLSGAKLWFLLIVFGEFRDGIAGLRHRTAYENWLDSYLPQFELLAVTVETSLSYATLRVALKQSGRPIPANDACKLVSGAHGMRFTMVTVSHG
ncbi:MAG: hypothetical protein U1F68_06750 [Gammaproteobacteria bacterium]